MAETKRVVMLESERTLLLEHLRRDHHNLFATGTGLGIGATPLTDDPDGNCTIEFMLAVHAASHHPSPYPHDEDRWTRRADDPRGTFRLDYPPSGKLLEDSRVPVTIPFLRNGTSIQIDVTITWHRPDGCWVGFAEIEELWVLLTPPNDFEDPWQMELSFDNPSAP